MEIDDAGPEPNRPELAEQGGPGEVLGDREPEDWNKGQMAITHGEPQPHIDADAMPESEGGPTGRRSNPGGGERFGDIDKG
jgi:hypothetical protein